MTRAIVAVCAAMVVLGAALALRWGGLQCVPDDEDLDDALLTHVPRVVRWFGAATLGGVGAGILVAGAGGRLAMRLLAVTGGADAQGVLTEADQAVGEITVDGTIGLIVFVGVAFGVVSGFLYLALRRWLPKGRSGGFAFGGLLLIVLATRLDPLRPGNEDFDLVGPGWLAVLVFALLALLHGMLVAAIATRWERFASRLEGRRRALSYVPVLLYAPVLPFLGFLILCGFIAAALTTKREMARALASSRALLVGRVAIWATALVALPFTIADVAAILDRS